MAVNEIDLMRMQSAIKSSSYQTAQQLKKAKKQQHSKIVQDYLAASQKASLEAIRAQVNTPARQAFMEKYGNKASEENASTAISQTTPPDTKAIKDAVAAQIEADTKKTIEKITNTRAKQVFMEKYGIKKDQLQNDEVSLSQEALAKLFAEKFDSNKDKAVQSSSEEPSAPDPESTLTES